MIGGMRVMAVARRRGMRVEVELIGSFGVY